MERVVVMHLLVILNVIMVVGGSIDASIIIMGQGVGMIFRRLKKHMNVCLCNP